MQDWDAAIGFWSGWMRQLPPGKRQVLDEVARKFKNTVGSAAINAGLDAFLQTGQTSELESALRQEGSRIPESLLRTALKDQEVNILLRDLEAYSAEVPTANGGKGGWIR